MHLRSLSLFALATVSLALASCTGENKPEKVTAPEKTLTEVSGKITVNGQPTEGVNVSAKPTKDQSLIAGGTPTAKTDAQGAFSFSTGAKPGVAAGDYVLLFDFGTYNMMRKQTTGDKFRGAYANLNKNAANKAFLFTVQEGQPVTIAPIDLTMQEVEQDPTKGLGIELKR
jgi:hypothetical protein